MSRSSLRLSLQRQACLCGCDLRRSVSSLVSPLLAGDPPQQRPHHTSYKTPSLSPLSTREIEREGGEERETDEAKADRCKINGLPRRFQHHPSFARLSTALRPSSTLPPSLLPPARLPSALCGCEPVPPYNTPSRPRSLSLPLAPLRHTALTPPSPPTATAARRSRRGHGRV